MTPHTSGQFSGKIAVITGAAGTIGLAVAEHLASLGADIALLDLQKDKLEDAATKVRQYGTTVRPYVCDVTDAQCVNSTTEQVVSDFGKIDFLFNNAGFQGAFAPVQDYPEEDFNRVIQINVCGAFHVLQAVARQMVAQKSGAIVNTASMAGVQGPPNMAAYGASKFAIVGLTQTASKDLAPHNIRVNAISPAFMGPGPMWDMQVEKQAKAKTQYFSTDPETVAKQMIGSVPMRRYGNISEIPGVVSFLLSDAASYMTGVNLPIAGGIL